MSSSSLAGRGIGSALAHLVGGFAHAARGVGHLLLVALARETFELPRDGVGLGGQAALVGGHRAAIVLSAAGVFLLLAPSQLAQLLEQRVRLLSLLLLLVALDRLVLVAHAVQLERRQSRRRALPTLLPSTIDRGSIPEPVTNPW